MRNSLSSKLVVIWWLLLILVDNDFIDRRADAASVHFREDNEDVYLLRPPTLDRRFGGSSPIDEDASLERGDAKSHVSSNRPRDGDFENVHRADISSASALDRESEVQSFLVLKLPSPYLSRNGRSDTHASDYTRDSDHASFKTTKFSVAEGGFEAEGELDSNVPSATINGPASDASDSSSNADHAFTFHQSIEHEFTARVLTFRVGRERPIVRVLIWRKSSSAAAGRDSSHPCVDVYALHPRMNEAVAGHCPTSGDHWPAGVCMIDLLLPLKWWSSILAKSDGASGSGGNAYDGFAKIKIGFSAFASTAKILESGASASETDSSTSSYCRLNTAPTGTSSQSTASYVLSAQAQRSMKIFGEVELIYPSEYALLPLNNVVKVLVPTVDYYPGTTFTVPIFIHYEPPKLNNSSIYLLHLRARASGHLRVVGVEEVDPDWAVSFNIEDGGTVVTSTASHRSVSLNESWAGEVFVLIVKIERDTSSANLNNQRPSKGATVSAQLTWSVRLVVDSGLSVTNENDLVSPQDSSFTSPAPSMQGAGSSTQSNGEKASPGNFEKHRSGKHAGETVSTHVSVQPDRVDTLAVIGGDEIVNTAVINGRQVSVPIRVISVSQGGVVDDVTEKSHCVAIDASSLKVSAACSSVYVDGTETRSNTNAAIGVQYGSYRTVARYTVWYPEFPIDIWIADPVLHSVSGWSVPATIATEGTGSPQKQPQFRNRRHNEQFRSRALYRRSKTTPMNNGGCRQKFQESELKIYARFRANDPTTGGQTYLGGAGRKVQLDLTQMARPFLRVKNNTVARLVHTKYSTFVEGVTEGRTEIQLKSPVQRHPYGSSVVETANEQVHLRSLSAEVITGLFFHSELKTPYPPVYKLAIYKSSTFFRRYQEGTVSLTLRYSDGHRTNLDALDSSYYRLYVATNGSITLFPGTSNGRHRHSSSQSTRELRNDVDSDGVVFLPVKILTVDEHAEGARLNVTLAPPSSCPLVSQKTSSNGILAFASVPVECSSQRRKPALQNDDVHQQAAAADAALKARTAHLDPLIPSEPLNGKPAVLTLPTSDERSLSNTDEHQQQGYGNAPLLASISVSVFAVAGVLFAACAVREGWVTVKSFARSRCRQWRLLVPLSMTVPPLVFTSARRRRRGGSRRRSASSSSSTNASVDDEDDDDSPPPGSNRRRNRRRGKRRRNSRPNAAECTESSVVSAENEFVWLRPMSLTSSSSNGPALGSSNGGGTVTRSLNGDIERRSTSGRRSLNGDVERRSNGDKPSFGGRDNAEYVISENEFLECCGSRRGLNGNRRGSDAAPSACLSSSVSTVSSNSGVGMESKDDDCCVDDETFTDTDADGIGLDGENNKILTCNGHPTCYRAKRKMSEAIQGHQRGSYILHEGATTLPSGWSGSEDYGSIGPPICSRKDKHGRNHTRDHHNQQGHQHHHDHRCSHQRNGNSAANSFVQRLLSTRSDPSVHIRPTPTTAEAAAAAVEAAKRQCKNQQPNRHADQQKQDQVIPLRNGHQQRRPQSLFGNQLRSSVCSAASSGGASSDFYWDSSTLGMNEAELRDYFNCLRESVT